MRHLSSPRVPATGVSIPDRAAGDHGIAPVLAAPPPPVKPDRGPACRRGRSRGPGPTGQPHGLAQPTVQERFGSFFWEFNKMAENHLNFELAYLLIHKSKNCK